MALAIALLLAPIKLKPIPTAAAALVLAAALTTASYTVFKQDCDAPDTVQARLALFRSNAGTDPADEYTPIAADNDTLSHANPPYWLAQDPTVAAPPNSTPGPAPTHLSITTPTAQNLILNLRNYPSWRITRDGATITTREQRDDGLIAIPVPTGKSNIIVTYSRPLDQTLGDILSALALILLLFILRNQRRSKPNPETLGPNP
jgi:hypothetical protein